ncbi:bifunctional RNase H/acid phosphatase [Mycobacteroides sp. LB1]|uniref:bifunctional RNase H/acid phosphatase n=1 Tax=Mycobacteroides sp. LB1 TaxID=2750814 RepID=UPI0015DED053|nr:bifunctional RNase H/acid phosphatase [Mycobacteroides sp. LB1]
MKVLVEADGGSRGNPGLAGYGTVVFAPDHETVLGEACEAIGHATNNVAEYRGLIAGLAEAARLGATEVSVSMDSKLVVEQMSGRWKVKHPDLITLYRQAVTAAMQFESVNYKWIPRERNKHADRLANEAMDRASGIEPKQPKKSKEAAEPKAKPADTAPGWTGARGKPTRMLLLRHGQTELSVQRRYSGRGNPELTELGREQAAMAARYLAGRGGISAVISSPLSRARETAAAAADALGVPYTVDDDLIETDFGTWEGLTFSEAAERDPELHGRWLSDTSVIPPEGESFDTVHHRVRRARNRIIAEHGGATVLVVSHVTPIKTLLRLALDAGPSLLYRLHLDLASLSIAEFYSDGPASVRLMNETSYLT